MLEAGPRLAGAWPSYYDSLRVFSPARFSQFPEHRPFEGDPDRYPSRDDVAAYLEDFAAGLDAEIRTNTPVVDVAAAGAGYIVHTASGEAIEAAGIVAASGSFTNPHRPHFPGQDTFTGQLLHAAEYRNPAPFTGQRVVVVGAGNSAVQIACELAAHATVTLASHQPLTLVEQRPGGKDLHYALTAGFDHLPAEWFARFASGPLAIDVGGYRDAFDQGLRRCRFTRASLSSWIQMACRTVFSRQTPLQCGHQRPQLDCLLWAGCQFGPGTNPVSRRLRAYQALERQNG